MKKLFVMFKAVCISCGNTLPSNAKSRMCADCRAGGK